jgi:PAS domain S-box-containing protein
MTEQSLLSNGQEQVLREENERLHARLAELRTRLKEPEEIIRAIRHGEVDAFVVTEPPGERVYTLRTADMLYRVLVEDMQEGAVALDSEGLVIYCNWHFASMMKTKREALLGRSIFPFVPQENCAFFDPLQHAHSIGTSRRELELLAADGQRVPVLLTLNRIDLEQQDVFCLIATDLTDQKRQEEIVSASRRKDEFLAMLAHELRNPIAPIRNAATVLRMAAPSDPDIQWVGDVIERQVTQLTRLVDDLLDVSRITSGKIRLKMEPVDLEAVIVNAVEAARPAIDARGHELIVNRTPGPLKVRGDAARLTQIVGNLLNNAVKFTPDKGRISLWVERHGDEAVIRIRDTGDGIAREMLPRIFDLFTQADATLERSQGGLGIGLTLVKRLVDMHGGHVTAASDGPGTGSEFSVRLPLLSNESLATKRLHLPQESASCTPCRVLVVDDNRDAAESLARLIRQWGHQVKVALTGPAALAEFAALRPHVVLLDIGLPGTSGYDVARQMREVPGLEDAMLVALTGFGQEEDRRRAEAAGFDLHWVKPAQAEELQSLLSEVTKES